MPPALAVGTVGRMLSTSLSPQRLGQVLGSVCWGWGQHSGTKAGMGNVLPPRCLSHQCHPLSPRGWWGVWGGRLAVRRFLEVSPLLSGPAVSQRLRQQPRALCL